MHIEDVEYEILQGLSDRERPADLLYMCHSVAASRLAHGQDFYGFEIQRFTLANEERRVRLLFGAGLLLCPIFDPVKHQDFDEYSAQMLQTRHDYIGIATDPDLKLMFGRGVEAGIAAGSFESLEAANETGLWKILQPQLRSDYLSQS